MINHNNWHEYCNIVGYYTMGMEQQILLNALNEYANKMKIGITDSPIVFRRVKLEDALVNDNLKTDSSITDKDERIEKGSFESGDYFALTEDGIFVYTNERVSRNLHCLF